MKTTRVLLPGLMLGSLACCALAAPEPAETLFGTNVVLSLRPLAFQPRDEQSLPHSGSFLTESQLRLVVQAREQRRLNLDVPHGLPVRADDGKPAERANSVEWAERLNAEAMRRYREQWEERLSAPSVLPVPALYRSKVEENLK